MGREIRRVPKDWEHPKDKDGNYIPLYDADYDADCEKWMDELDQWRRGEHEDQDNPGIKRDYPYFWEWNGYPPDRASYRERKWSEEEATCYQIYETVSEGTPVSPVFESEDEMWKWLVNEGYSHNAARKFIEHGFAPSGVFVPGKGFMSGIHSMEMM